MARYETDEIDAARMTFPRSDPWVAAIDLCKGSLRRLSLSLNKNVELVDELCSTIGDGVQDTIGSIVTLAKDAGAHEARSAAPTARAAE